MGTKGAGRTGADRGRYWMIVHCSAGVGRTGTFISILRAMHRLRFMKGIQDLTHTINETITHLRRSRLWMVKTDGEYATIFCAMWHRLQAYGFDRPVWGEETENEKSSSESTLDRLSQRNEDVKNYRGVGFRVKRAKAEQ